MVHRYETDGAEIYRQSFATIRREASLDRFTPTEERVVVRMVHAAGMVELAPHVEFSPGMAEAAEQALRDGAPVLCDKQYGGRSQLTRGELWRDPADQTVLLARQALHAHRIAFSHPGTGQRLQIEAPLPDDLQQLLADLRSRQSSYSK